MSTIRVEGDSSLGQVLRENRNLGFITVRDGEGNVLWSHTIEEWKLEALGSHTEITVQTQDIRDRIEEDLRVRRGIMENELRQKGLL